MKVFHAVNLAFLKFSLLLTLCYDKTLFSSIVRYQKKFTLQSNCRITRIVVTQHEQQVTRYSVSFFSAKNWPFLYLPRWKNTARNAENVQLLTTLEYFSLHTNNQKLSMYQSQTFAQSTWKCVRKISFAKLVFCKISWHY